MPIIRNRLSSALSGGPRQHNELRDRFLIEVDNNDSIREVASKLDSISLQHTSLTNYPVVMAYPSRDITDTLENLRNVVDGRHIRRSIKQLENAEDEIVESTSNMLRATREVLRYIKSLNRVNAVDFVKTYVDYGPEQLRVSPFEMDTATPENYQDVPKNQGDLMDKLEMESAWDITTGSNAIVAIFDTGFAEGLVDMSRIVGTFSGDEVSSVYAPAEGHGTMTMGAAVANSDMGGVPYDGVAKGSDVILVRITDEEGQIRSDIISEALDWISDFSGSRGGDKPIVANHSYGVPLCNSRPRSSSCNTPTADLMRRINADESLTSVYAAGNEAMQCGHRPSGITSGITGENSLQEVITVGALRFDGVDAQRYSSHGRGDCSPISDPKPNVSCAIPSNLYYGVEGGWEVKDMGMGMGGSSGGTSTASPLVAGKIALLQSRAVEKRGEPMQTEEIKQIIHRAAEPPRRTQINMIPGVAPSGWDARFGHGQINILEALREV